MKCLFIFLLSVAFTLTSCGGKRIMYAKYGKLKLSENEFNAYPVSSQQVNAFEQCCYTESDQIFLNRAISNNGAGYDIFISVSETIHQSEFAAIQAADPLIVVMDSKSELASKIKVTGFLLKKSNHFVARFIYHEVKSGILVIYDYTSKDENGVKDCYNNMVNYLDEKIHL